MNVDLEKIFSSRPGFPRGLRVLLIDEESTKQSQHLHQQLEELAYEVTCCSTGSEAATLLRREGSSFDIVLVEAKALAKESSDGGSLREAAAHLPLVLMSEKGSSTDDVWRGIELGAADVLEKPLSSLKLRNIWQHVVRRMMSSAAESKDGQQPVSKVESKSRLGRGVSAPSSPRTPSPAASLLTIGSETATDKSCKGGDEASFSGAATLKNARSADVPEQCDLRASADSLVVKVESAPAIKAEAGPALPAVKTGCSSRKSKRAKGPDTPASVASRPPLAIRPPAWATPSPHMGAPVVGIAPPHCFMQAVDPLNGCVWGTPALCASQPPSAFAPHARGYSAGAPPMSAACSMGQPGITAGLHTCPSGGGSSLASSLDSSLTLCGFGGDYMGDEDALLDDVLLPDEDLLDLAPDEPTMKAPELPPIGLKLKKSPSLVDLINAQLSSAPGFVA